MFHLVVDRKEDRSMMNVCFRGNSEAEEKAFVSFCEKHNIVGIKGHRFVGGFRVSLYNAVTVEQVDIDIAGIENEETRKNEMNTSAALEIDEYRYGKDHTL